MATPEKALLDLIYLTLGADSEAYIRALCLQNLDQIDTERLAAYVERINKPKLSTSVGDIGNKVSLPKPIESPIFSKADVHLTLNQNTRIPLPKL